MATTMSGMKKFFNDLDRFAVLAAEQAPRDRRNEIALFMLEGVITRTPVDKGRAKGNWQVTTGGPAEGTLKRNSKSGQAPLSEGSTRILSDRTGLQDLWITNNVSYILVLEDGLFEPKNPDRTKDKRRRRKGTGEFPVLVKDGFSTQAPEGMLGVTFLEAKTVFGL